MPVTIVIGSQWGDEGKGKIVDLLAPEADVVARYQGGANAGHTIMWGDKTFVLHLVPSGIFHDGTACVIGNGVVIDPAALMREIHTIEELGFGVEGRLFISHHAHLIMPYHKAIEEARERYRDAGAIGTTGRGIGPAYVDKFARTGIRVVDLLDRDLLRKKLKTAIEEKNAILRSVYGADGLDVEALIEEYVEFDRQIDPYVKDTAAYLHRALKDGQHVLAEGAQGSLLDVDFGTYPFVTSSHPTAGGCCTGLGVPPTAVDRVIGIVKAYTTRVGNGPFPTELDGSPERDPDGLGEVCAARATSSARPPAGPVGAAGWTWWPSSTPRPSTASPRWRSPNSTCWPAWRSCGSAPRTASTASSPTASPATWRSSRPWSRSTKPSPASQISATASRWRELPATAREYLRFMEDHLEVPISLLSTGPKREQTIRVAPR
jgi:adenylosuccinate synthase